MAEKYAGILSRRKYGYHKSTPAILRQCREWNKNGLIPYQLRARLAEAGIEVSFSTCYFWALGITEYSKDRPSITVLRQLIEAEEPKLEHRFMDSFTILRKVVAEQELAAAQAVERKQRVAKRRSRAEKEAAQRARKAQQGKFHKHAQIQPAYDPIEILADGEFNW
jgi:hypothetical protein